MQRFLISIIIGIAGMFLSGHLKAQQNTPLPLITLEMRQVSLAEIFTELEKQSGMFFSYESSVLQELPKISFSVTEEYFSYTLKRLFENLPLHYRITGQYIIVKSKPRQYTIRGFVRDSITYESLINASVYEQISGKGVTTNSYGFYSITLPAGTVRIRSSYVGFVWQEIAFELQGDTLLDISLPPLDALQEVVVKGSDIHSVVMNSQMGNMEVSSNYMRQVPVVFSEPDPLKIMQLMPGISPGTEGLTGIYVRGGGNDQNLFLLDGIPVYNTGHIGGLFSTFNPDVIKHVDFYKGGFPAHYGGRLSSVMDIRLKEGNKETYHGSFSFGLLSMRAQVEGPVRKDKTSFNLAFRRTWLDAITAPAFAITNRNSEEEIVLGYSFYDLNGKISHLFSHKSRLYLNFYLGQDRLRSKLWEDYDGVREGSDLRWRWGNLVSSANWTYIFNNKLFATFDLAYSRYKSKMRDESVLRNYNFYYGDNTQIQYNSKINHHFSGIEDLSYKAAFDYSPQPNHYIRFGTNYIFHRYHPEYTYLETSKREGEKWSNKQYLYVDEKVQAHEWSLYAEDDWSVNDRWKVHIGGRMTTYHVEGKTYLSLQPRLSARYLIKDNWSVKSSYVKMNQYVHQLSTTYANLPSDIWVPVTSAVKPMYMHQISAGTYYTWKDWLELSCEAYFKKMHHIIDYQDYASLFPKYTSWDQKISVGEGRAYGIEWMASKTEGRTTGSAAYTLSWSDRQFEDGTVNSGKRFPSRYDNRHRFNITVMHKLSKKLDISASWLFATGNRVTVPLGSYMSIDENNTYPDWINSEPIYSRNAVKLGNYHRLDLGMNLYRPKKKGRMGIWNISLYNAYCRLNPFRVDGVQYKEPGKVTVMQTGFIPVIPSFSYTFKF